MTVTDNAPPQPGDLFAVEGRRDLIEVHTLERIVTLEPPVFIVRCRAGARWAVSAADVPSGWRGRALPADPDAPTE